MWLASFGSMTAASRLTGTGGRSWTKGFFLLKPYRFGYRFVIVLLSFWVTFFLHFSYVFVYVEASMECNKKRTTRWAGSKWTAWLLSLAAWMCNSCSLAAGLLGSFVARQLGC